MIDGELSPSQDAADHQTADISHSEGVVMLAVSPISPKLQTVFWIAAIAPTCSPVASVSDHGEHCDDRVHRSGWRSGTSRRCGIRWSWPSGSGPTYDRPVPKLLLLDGHSLAYRAFFALPSDLATKTGTVTNAVYGFTSMLAKVLADEKPDYIAVAFDTPGRPHVPLRARPRVQGRPQGDARPLLRAAAADPRGARRARDPDSWSSRASRPTT